MDTTFNKANIVMSRKEETVSEMLFPHEQSYKKPLIRRFLSGRSLQFITAFIGSLCAFNAGISMGWSSQITEELLDGEMGFAIAKNQMGWIGSFLALGALSFSVAGGFFSNYFGEKKTMLLLVFPNIVGWCLLIWPNGVTMMCVGRFLTGIATGSYLTLSIVYISNIAEKDLKGILGSFTGLMIVSGILYSNIFGLIFSIRYFTISCAVTNLIFGFLLILLPETPTHLIRKSQSGKARAVLRSLRMDNYDVNGELATIEENMSTNESFFTLAVLKKPKIQKACVVSFGLLIFKKASGIDAIIDYTSYIFQSAQLYLTADIQTIIMGTISTLSAIFQTYIIAKVGYRILVCVSTFFMFISLTVVAIVFSLKERHIIHSDGYIYVDYLPLIALIIYSIALACGLGPVSWILVGEMFPENVRSSAASVAICLLWSSSFFVSKIFFFVIVSLGTDAAFFMFALCAFFAFLFGFFLVPDGRKGRSN